MKIRTMSQGDLLQLEQLINLKKEVFVWIVTTLEDDKNKEKVIKDTILSTNNITEKEEIKTLLGCVGGIHQEEEGQIYSIAEFDTNKKRLENKIRFVKGGKCPYKLY